MYDNSQPKLIDVFLRQQGLVPTRGSDKDQLVLSADVLQMDALRSDERVQVFRRSFSSDSYRKLLRALIASRGERVPLATLERITGRTLEYLENLALLRVVENRDGVFEIQASGVLWTRKIDNIGPTLEWYVADLCERELYASARWGVQLEGLPAGGDYDVLASLSFGVLYIETKSAAPASITPRELRNFMQRHGELEPAISILLIDTQDDIRDVVKRLPGSMPYGRPNWDRVDNELRDFPGVYFVPPSVYVTNARPLILTQLRRCLRHFHLHGQHAFVQQHVYTPAQVADYFYQQQVMRPLGI
jgi:hypothetical protein